MELLLLLILWLISPIILGIVCILQRKKINRLENELSELSRLGVRNVPPAYTPQPTAKPDTPAPVYCPPADIPKSLPEVKAPAYDTSGKSYKPAEIKSQPPVNIILIIGALFIILAGFVFAAAAWGTLNAVFKSAVLLSFSAVFFAVHFFARYKLKLESTGRVFYVLGSVFLPAAIAAGGKLKVFGDFLSFEGNGWALLFMIMFIMLAVCFFIGAKSYLSRIYARIAFLSVSAAASFLMLHGRNVPMFSAVIVAFYVLAVIIAEPQLKKRFDGSVIFGEYRFFMSVNTVIPAIISLFISHGGAEHIIPAAMFSAAFLAGSLKSDHPETGAAAFAVYLMTGMLSGMRPNSAEGFILTSSAVMVVYTCLIAMDIVPEAVKKTVGIVQKIAAVPIIFSGIILMLGNGYEFDPQLLISAAAVAVQMIILTFKSGNGRLFSMFSVIWLAFETGALVNELSESTKAALFCSAAMIFVYFAVISVTRIKEKFRSVYTDAVSCIALLVLLCMCNMYGTGFEWLMWVFVLAATFISACDNSFGRVFLPISVFSVYFPVNILFSGIEWQNRNDSPTAFTFCTAVVIYCAVAVIFIVVPKLRKFSLSMEWGVAAVSLLYIMPMTDSAHILAPAALTVFAGINMAVNRESRFGSFYGNYFLTLLCLTLFESGRYSELSEKSTVLPAAALLVMFGIYMFIMSEDSKVKQYISSFIGYALPLYGIFMMLMSGEYDDTSNFRITGVMNELPLFYICAAALVICGCVYFVREKRSVLITIAMCAFYINTAAYFDNVMGTVESAVFTTGLMILANIFGRVIFCEKIVFKTDRGACFDFLSLSSFIGCFILLWQGLFRYDEYTYDDYIVWAAFLTAGLICLNLKRNGGEPSLDRFFLTAAAVFVMPVWWLQPFFEPLPLLETEWNVAAAPLFAVLFGSIHKDQPEKSGKVYFAAGIICLTVLLGSAYSSGHPIDAVILGGVILLMMVISHIRKDKKWFVLSAVAAVGEALMLTVKLWNDRTWWVYLLAVGIILIFLGMSREAAKRKNNVSSQEETHKSDLN